MQNAILPFLLSGRALWETAGEDCTLTSQALAGSVRADERPAGLAPPIGHGDIFAFQTWDLIAGQQHSRTARPACWNRAGYSLPKREISLEFPEPDRTPKCLQTRDFGPNNSICFEFNRGRKIPKRELPPIPVHGYHIVSGPGRVPGGAIWR